MMLIRPKKLEFIHFLFISFILIQPLLDLFTGLSLRLTETQFSISLVVRAFFMLCAGIYLLFIRNHPYQKKYIYYFLILGNFMLINIIINYFQKPSFHLMSEITFIFKTTYFVVVFVIYWLVFQSLKEKGMETVLKFISISITLYTIIIFIAEITGTAFQSYKYNKVGHVGWFYAGNEIGVILAMGLPVLILMAVKYSNIYWIPVFFTVYSLFSIGTKVGYLALVLTLIVAFIFVTKDYILSKRKNEVVFERKKIIILSLFLIGSLLYTPFSPIAENMNIHISLIDSKKQISHQKNDKINDDEKVDESDTEFGSEEVKELIYSGRNDFLRMFKEYYNEAPLSQKLFGMGYAGNYIKKPKLIEMDYHDIFYGFGIIGFAIYFIPLIYFLYHVVKELLNTFSQFFRYENILILTGCALGLGVAFIAGHVLTAPSVSYFLAILIATALTSYRKSEIQRKSEIK